MERAKIETSLKNIIQFSSYRDILKTLNELSINTHANFAAEMNGLTWSLSNSLIKNFPDIKFIPSDKLIAMVRSIKSEWELLIMRKAGAKHNKCLTELLPNILHEGINELEVSHKLSDIFYSEGHNGIVRMETFGEELFSGHVAIGDSGNYPSVFNGPNGIRGTHPAVPYMGSEHVKWNTGSPLLVDNGFTVAGYHTDKTQSYWLGSKKSIPETVQSAFDFCVDIQNKIAAQLRPGVVPSELWKQTTELLANSPWEEGFMGLGKNKVGFLGHGIGLAIDEYPVIAKGFDLPLEEGMVLALEPKIGIPGIGMVGIENTFEISSNGGQSLTGNFQEIINI
jgi:Xaa-Pro aminopeptidase